MKTLTSLALVLSALATPTFASAQATADITDAIDQGTRIEAARDAQQFAQPENRLDEDEIIDGEAGIYVLKVNDIFYVAGGAGGGWSENPLRTSDDAGGSGFANAVLTAGVQTKIAEEFDFGASATISGIEYQEDFAPSSRSINGSAFVGRPIQGTPLYIGVNVYGGQSYDGNFNRGTWFYGANAQATLGKQIGDKTLARATVSGGRNENEISENNNWNAVFNAELTHFVSENVAVGVQARLTRTWFDDFFEDVTFAARQDWQYGGNVNLSWAPYQWLAVTGSLGYEQRDSDFFLSSYDGIEAAISVTTRKRF